MSGSWDTERWATGPRRAPGPGFAPRDYVLDTMSVGQLLPIALVCDSIDLSPTQPRSWVPYTGRDLLRGRSLRCSAARKSQREAVEKSTKGVVKEFEALVGSPDVFP